MFQLSQLTKLKVETYQDVKLISYTELSMEINGLINKSPNTI